MALHNKVADAKRKAAKKKVRKPTKKKKGNK